MEVEVYGVTSCMSISPPVKHIHVCSWTLSDYKVGAIKTNNHATFHFSLKTSKISVFPSQTII